MPFTASLATYGAVNGSSPTTALQDWATAAKAALVSSPGLATMQVPAGDFPLSDWGHNAGTPAKQHAVYNSPQINVFGGRTGITKFLGIGPTADPADAVLRHNGVGFMTGTMIPIANQSTLISNPIINYSWRFADAPVGATSIVLRAGLSTLPNTDQYVPGDLTEPASYSTFWGHLHVGDWVCLAGIDIQGAGYAPNAMYFQYVKITALDLPTNTVTFAGHPLRDAYKSTWPIYKVVFNTNDPDEGGPGTIYVLDQDWDKEIEWRNITVGTYTTPFSQVAVCGRDVTFNNTIHTGDGGFFPQQNQIIRFIDTDATATLDIEMDKLVDELIVDNSQFAKLNVQSSGRKVTIQNGSTINNLVGGARYTELLDSTFGTAYLGVIAYGNTFSYVVSGCSISDLRIGGLEDMGAGNMGLNLDPAFDMVAGVMQKAGTPPTWAVPGALIFWHTSTNSTIGSFRILDITRDVPNQTTYIETDWTHAGGGWPDTNPAILLGGTKVGIRSHPCPSLVWHNSGWSLDKHPDGEAYATYWEPTIPYNKSTIGDGVNSFTGNLWGRLTYIEIDVITAHSAAAQLNFPSVFDNTTLVRANMSSYTLIIHIDLATAGKRVWTAATGWRTNTGSGFVPGGVGLDALPSDIGSDGWFMHGSQFGTSTNISASTSSLSVNFKMRTEQGKRRYTCRHGAFKSNRRYACRHQ